MLNLPLGPAVFNLRKDYKPEQGMECRPLDVVNAGNRVWGCRSQTTNDPAEDNDAWMLLFDGEGINAKVAVRVMRETFAGTVHAWPTLNIPTLSDELPLGLSLDGAAVSLEAYPRLACVLCPEADNAWMPAWFRCNADGTRSISGQHIKLDDWRGGTPRALDMGRGIDQSTVLVTTTAGNNQLTIVNNLSAGGTLLAPSTSAEGFYPGIAVSGPGIPTGAVVTAVADTTVSLSINCTATAASIEATLTGRVPGSWQGAAMPRLVGTQTFQEMIGYVPCTGVFAGVDTRKNNNARNPGERGGQTVSTFDTARITPTAPFNRPAGPAAHYIILV